MTIAVDLTSLSYHITGIERYALCITKELLRIDKNNSYILVFRDKVYDDFDDYIGEKNVSARIVSGNNKYFFQLLKLPFELYKIKAEKYLFLAFTNPTLFVRKGIITTIHDMTAWDFPKSLTFIKRLHCHINGRISAAVSEKIITVSEFSKGRIMDITHTTGSKIYVIYSAVSDSLKQLSDNNAGIIKKYQFPSKYILTLSTLEPRKNIKLLIQAFSEVAEVVDYDLVLAGRKGWSVSKILADIKGKERIHITGYVDDEALSNIYRNALCFCFPTLYEGFGLPPVEALSFGTPVISSDAASMPEVLRKQAVYFKSGDKEELKKLLLNLEKMLPSMPVGLDEYQKTTYDFKEAARKVLEVINQ